MTNNLSNEEFLVAAGVGITLLFILIFGNLIRNRNKTSLPPLIKERKKHTALKEPAAPLEPSAENRPQSPPSKSWSERLYLGLRNTHGQIIRNLEEFFLNKKDKASRDEILEYLFELLIQADVGVRTTEILVERVRGQVSKDGLTNIDTFLSILQQEILVLLNNTLENKKGLIDYPKSKPHVVLMVGVNGVGKTTTTGKLAFKAFSKDQKVVIGAADTFRAAAVEQLSIWAQRSQADMIRLKEGSDPASVAYEAVKKAREVQADLCFIDTAGRLQTRVDLMQELSKINRVVGKDFPGAPHEVLLVLDASTGQNALQQARLFRDAVQVSGLILTKLDGSAKGGIAIAIAAELGLPICYVGVGEGVEDLDIFDAKEFVEALFSNKASV